MRVADLELRPATLEDAAGVADVHTLAHPDDPEDPLMAREWWETSAVEWTWERYVAEVDGRVVAWAGQGHPSWDKMPERFARVPFDGTPDIRTRERLEALAAFAEERAAADGALRLACWAWENDGPKTHALERRGFREERRQRFWELDLLANGDRLAQMTEVSRARMREQGIEILTLDRVSDPDRYRKLWRMTNEAEEDVPTTVPHVETPFEAFLKWFASPALRDDRIWVAREGDDLVGISMLAYPPVRGVVSTDWTGTARRVRGHGVARSLKCETVMQAIALGVDRVRTDNDFQNAPILHLNGSMGYRLRKEKVQYVKDAAAS